MIHADNGFSIVAQLNDLPRPAPHSVQVYFFFPRTGVDVTWVVLYDGRLVAQGTSALQAIGSHVTEGTAAAGGEADT